MGPGIKQVRIWAFMMAHLFWHGPTGNFVNIQEGPIAILGIFSFICMADIRTWNRV